MSGPYTNYRYNILSRCFHVKKKGIWWFKEHKKHVNHIPWPTYLPFVKL